MSQENVFRRIEFGVENFVDSNGMLHNVNDSPARISLNQYGASLREWYRHGFLHRENDKPAFDGVIQSGNSFVAVQGWFINGKAHRIGGPAAIEENLTTGIVTITYSTDGKLDRTDGPAVVRFLKSRNTNLPPQVIDFSYFVGGTQIQNPGVPLLVVSSKHEDTIFPWVVIHDERKNTAVEEVDTKIDKILAEPVLPKKEQTQDQTVETKDQEAAEHPVKIDPPKPVIKTQPAPVDQSVVKRGRGRPKKVQ